jgi:hypothetical protein
MTMTAKIDSIEAIARTIAGQIASDIRAHEKQRESDGHDHDHSEIGDTDPIIPTDRNAIHQFDDLFMQAAEDWVDDTDRCPAVGAIQLVTSGLRMLTTFAYAETADYLASYMEANENLKALHDNGAPKEARKAAFEVEVEKLEPKARALHVALHKGIHAMISREEEIKAEARASHSAAVKDALKELGIEVKVSRFDLGDTLGGRRG